MISRFTRKKYKKYKIIWIFLWSVVLVGFSIDPYSLFYHLWCTDSTVTFIPTLPWISTVHFGTLHLAYNRPPVRHWHLLCSLPHLHLCPSWVKYYTSPPPFPMVTYPFCPNRHFLFSLGRGEGADGAYNEKIPGIIPRLTHPMLITPL